MILFTMLAAFIVQLFTFNAIRLCFIASLACMVLILSTNMLKVK